MSSGNPAPAPTESQNCRGWKGPKEITGPNPIGSNPSLPRPWFVQGSCCCLATPPDTGTTKSHPHSAESERGTSPCPAEHNCKAPRASPGIKPDFLFQRDNSGGEGEAGRSLCLLCFMKTTRCFWVIFQAPGLENEKGLW